MEITSVAPQTPNSSLIPDLASSPTSQSPADKDVRASSELVSIPLEHKSLFDVLRAMGKSPKPKTTLRPKLVEEQVKQNGVDVKKQLLQVTTNDGYTIKFNDENHDWTITSPDKRVTKIWGDPHVDESDGDSWSFVNGSSFVFGNNKITVDTKPIGNGQSITKTVTIYNGHDRVTVSGIDTNIPKLDIWSRDGVEGDLAKADGDIFDLTRHNDRDAWVKRTE